MVKAIGLTESGRICEFKMRLGQIFVTGAGIAPTHGGFLMCGLDTLPHSPTYRVFSVSLNSFNITVD